MGPHWVERAERAALTLSARDASEDDSLGVRLLADLRRVFAASTEERLSTETVLERLTAIDDAPWGDWYGKPITSRKIAQILRPYGIKPKTIRFGDRIANGYERALFSEACERYVADDDDPEPLVGSSSAAERAPF